jgi:hypothetical protein
LRIDFPCGVAPKVSDAAPSSRDHPPLPEGWNFRKTLLGQIQRLADFSKYKKM